MPISTQTNDSNFFKMNRPQEYVTKSEFILNQDSVETSFSEAQDKDFQIQELLSENKKNIKQVLVTT